MAQTKNPVAQRLYQVAASLAGDLLPKELRAGAVEIQRLEGVIDQQQQEMAQLRRDLADPLERWMD